MLAAASLRAFDWAVLLAYGAAVVALGLRCARRGGGRSEFFLAGRSMPAWAVSCSVLATALSAATFIGAPAQSFAGNLTYFSAKLAELLAVVVVARLFLPAFYRHGVVSVYELLAAEYGTAAHRCASAMFMLGRALADGARLYIVSLPFSLIAFGSAQPRCVVLSALLIASAVAAYAVVGGIRAVIWTDVLQALVFVAAITATLWLLLARIPAGAGEIAAALASAPAPPGGSKLTIIDGSTDVSRPFTIWAVLLGWPLLYLAAYGTDQDLVQRMLTCRTARAAGRSALLAVAMTWLTTALLMLVGLLLWVRYERPDLAGGAAPEVSDARTVFVRFILDEMPAGLRGLMLAGLFAAAMSTLDSALNSLAAAAVSDFWRPWRTRRRGPPGDAAEVVASRAAVGLWAAVVAGFAGLCVLWQPASERTLVEFALDVMVFAYSGLLAVFLTALCTNRGSSASVAAALPAGVVAVALLRQVEVGAEHRILASPWQMLLATAIAFGVCCLGSRPGAQRRSARSRRSASSSVETSLQNAKRTRALPSAGWW